MEQSYQRFSSYDCQKFFFGGKELNLQNKVKNIAKLQDNSNIFYVFKPEKLLTLKFSFSPDDIKKNNSANIKDGSNEGGKDENVIQLYKHMKLKALIGKPVSDYSLSVAAF